MNKIKTFLKKILFLMDKKQKLYSLLSILLNLISSFFECIGVTAIIPLIAVILNKDSIHMNKLIQKLPYFETLDYTSIVLILCFFVVLIYIIKNTFFIFSTWIQVKFSCKLQRELSIKLLKAYMKCGYPYFITHDIGYFSRGLTTDISSFYNVLNLVFSIFSDFFTCIFVFCILVLTDWQMALSVVMAGTVCLLLMFFIFRKNMKIAGLELRKYDQLILILQNQTLYGIKDIITLRKQNYFINEIIKARQPHQEALIKQTLGTTSPVRIIEAIFVGAIIFMIGFKATTVATPSIFVAKLAAFAMGSFRILPALSRMSSSLNGITSRLPSINSLYENIIDSEKYTRVHPETNFDTPVSEQDRKGINFEKCIKITGLTFRYNSKLKPVLKDLNLEIQKGASIAFIGQSGSGKSTLMDIILGLLVPEKGKITIDEINISDIPESWAKIVGYIPQTVFLTDGTIADNIAFGIPKDKINYKLIDKVLKQAELYNFVETLADGIETRVGERGIRLSGGQRQRIAIARALYHEPQIMILDEATSALDNETEAAIMDAINNLQGFVTLIIVAHRLTTVQKCDIIYRVENQKISLCNKETLFNQK